MFTGVQKRYFSGKCRSESYCCVWNMTGLNTLANHTGMLGICFRYGFSVPTKNSPLRSIYNPTEHNAKQILSAAFFNYLGQSYRAPSSRFLVATHLKKTGLKRWFWSGDPTTRPIPAKVVPVFIAFALTAPCAGATDSSTSSESLGSPSSHRCSLQLGRREKHLRKPSPEHFSVNMDHE